MFPYNLKECSHIKEVLNHFKNDFLSVRLLKLKVGAFIKPHQGHALGYGGDCFRLHIPIIINNEVPFTLDQEAIKMQEGECWYTNVNLTHSVSNNGNSNRVHLVIEALEDGNETANKGLIKELKNQLDSKL